MLVLKKVKSNGMCSLVVFAQSRREAGWNQALGVHSDEPGLEGSERGSYRKWSKKKQQNRNKKTEGVPGMGKGSGKESALYYFHAS